MKHPVLSSAVLASLLAACAAPSGTGSLPGPLRGVASGFANATVCLDRNANARCDADEPRTTSGADGHFELPAGGALVAEAASPSGPLVLRSPADDQQADNNLVVNFNYMQQKYNLAPPPSMPTAGH